MQCGTQIIKWSDLESDLFENWLSDSLQKKSKLNRDTNRIPKSIIQASIAILLVDRQKRMQPMFVCMQAWCLTCHRSICMFSVCYAHLTHFFNPSIFYYLLLLPFLRSEPPTKRLTAACRKPPTKIVSQETCNTRFRFLLSCISFSFTWFSYLLLLFLGTCAPDVQWAEKKRFSLS